MAIINESENVVVAAWRHGESEVMAAMAAAKSSVMAKRDGAAAWHRISAQLKVARGVNGVSASK
jgi:hypothetical protein